jgi:penicillin-binding protein 1A
VAATETSMLETVLQYGTGKAAAIGQFAAGKTGTTSNYGDAWFVGWDSKYTVAVWVGYPNKLIPMTTDFNGTPVLGGTFPALIWHEFMISALELEKERSELAAEKAAAHGHAGAVTGAGASEVSSTPAPASSPATPGKTNGKATTPGATGNEAGEGAGTATPEKAAAEPTHEAPSTPAPATPATPGAPATPTPSPSQTGGVSASP